MRARNPVGIGLSYRPARLHSLAELVPWNRFLCSLKVYKFGALAGLCDNPIPTRFLDPTDYSKILQEGRAQGGNREEEYNGYVVCKLNIYGSAGEEDRGEGGGDTTTAPTPMKRRRYWFFLLLEFFSSGRRRKIRLIESNAKYRYLKKFTCKGTLQHVFICLRPPPLLGFCLGR